MDRREGLVLRRNVWLMTAVGLALFWLVAVIFAAINPEALGVQAIRAGAMEGGRLTVIAYEAEMGRLAAVVAGLCGIGMMGLACAIAG